MGYTDTPIGGGVIRRKIFGTDSIEDAVLVDDNCNYGSYNYIVIGYYNQWGKRRYLARITNSLPVGSILGFRFKMYRSVRGESVDPGTLNVFALSDANTWVEGNSSGIAEVGAVTYIYAKYNTQLWAGSSFASTSGLDYHADASPPTLDYSSFTTGSPYWVTLDLKSEWVTNWRDNIWINNGIIIRSTIETNTTNIFFGQATEQTSNQCYFEIDYIPDSNFRVMMLR